MVQPVNALLHVMQRALEDQPALLEAGANDLGCGYSSYNACEGDRCNYDNNCDNDCCTYGVCNDYYCDYNYNNLAWLWWTLGSFFLVLCIVSICIKAKRQRHHQMLAHTLHDSHSQHYDPHCDPHGGATTQVYYQQPGMAPGQPTMVQGQPMPGYQ